MPEDPKYRKITIIVETERGSQTITVDKATDEDLEIEWKQPEIEFDNDRKVIVPQKPEIEGVTFSFRPLPNKLGEYMTFKNEEIVSGAPEQQ